MDEQQEQTDNPVERWIAEIDLAEKRDKSWQKTGKDIVRRYRNEGSVDSDVKDHTPDEFNILWSNTEVMRPAIYSMPPRPDIRRRFTTKKKGNRDLVEVLERASSFCFEQGQLHQRMISATNDMLLPGRGVIRPRYEPTIVDGEVVSEAVGYKHWDWDCVLFGPGNAFNELPWIAFKHKLEKTQIEKKFGEEVAAKIHEGNDGGSSNAAEKTADEKKSEARYFKRTEFYEIWDKRTKRVYWLTRSLPDQYAGEEDDPLGLENFWPIPKPMYAIESSSSLVPVPEFIQYERLADQLEDVTVRMGRITRALRVRGIYDSTLAELRKLFEAGDNEFIPAEDVARMVESGGFDKAIWMFPNDKLAGVLGVLQGYRQQLIQQIYELTGISDILRGQSNPNETLGAQKIKANFGSQRLDKKRAEVQRFCKDLLKITVEIVAEKFSIDTLSQMTGLQFPRQEEKMQAQQVMQQAEMMKQQYGPQMQQLQQAAQQNPQAAQQLQQMQQMQQQMEQKVGQAQEVLSKPSWEELKQIMTSDQMRAYAVDIETDSTIAADQQADQEALTSLIQGVSQFGHGMKPLIEGGVLTQDSAKQILISMFRRFRLGRELEEAIDGESEEPQQPDPAQQAEQQKAQAEQQKAQVEAEKIKAQFQAEMDKLRMETQEAQMEHQNKMREMQAEMQRDREKHQFEMRKIAAQNESLRLKNEQAQ